MAASSNDYLFGFDMLFKTVENNIEQKTDILVLMAHFVLVKKGFRCIGVGEDKTIESDTKGDELLPAGWNAEQDKYALRYLNDGKLFLLLGHNAGSLLIINLLNVESKEVSNVGLDPEELVKALKGKFAELVPDGSALLERYRTVLVEPVSDGNSKNMETQTAGGPLILPMPNVYHDPLMVGGPRVPYHGRPFEVDPFGGVGRGDLDPLARGPGNLFPFPGLGRAPRPRFDPTLPNPNFGGFNPNPDHFQPPGGDPGYYDF